MSIYYKTSIDKKWKSSSFEKIVKIMEYTPVYVKLCDTEDLSEIVKNLEQYKNCIVGMYLDFPLYFQYHILCKFSYIQNLIYKRKYKVLQSDVIKTYPFDTNFVCRNCDNCKSGFECLFGILSKNVRETAKLYDTVIEFRFPYHYMAMEKTLGYLSVFKKIIKNNDYSYTVPLKTVGEHINDVICMEKQPYENMKVSINDDSFFDTRVGVASKLFLFNELTIDHINFIIMYQIPIVFYALSGYTVKTAYWRQLLIDKKFVAFFDKRDETRKILININNEEDLSYFDLLSTCPITPRNFVINVNEPKYLHTVCIIYREKIFEDSYVTNPPQYNYIVKWFQNKSLTSLNEIIVMVVDTIHKAYPPETFSKYITRLIIEHFLVESGKFVTELDGFDLSRKIHDSYMSLHEKTKKFALSTKEKLALSRIKTKLQKPSDSKECEKIYARFSIVANMD